MINFTDDPRGRELILLIERAKYQRWLEREVAQLLEREYNEIVDLVVSSKWRTLTQFQRDRALQLYREIERQLRVAYGNIKDLHVRELPPYAGLESEVARAQVSSMLSAPSAAVRRSLGAFLPRHTLQSIAALPIDGLRLGEWFDGQARSMSLATRRVIQSGLVAGKGPAEMARQIVGSRGSTERTVYRRARAEAIAITRTTVNAVQNHAAQLSYEGIPKEISDSYILDAVRDGRTSIICIALDGRVFRYDDPKKKVPPFHINCRTGTRPLVKGIDDKLIDQKKSLTFKSMEDWLKAQNTATQNDVLGAGRAQLWRDGKISLKDLIDSDNRVLSLAELKKRLSSVGTPASGTPPSGKPPAPAVPPKPTAPPKKAPQLADFLTGNTVAGVRGVKSGIKLPGVKPNVVKEITEAFDSVLSDAGVKIDGINLTQSKTAQGLYTFGRVREQGGWKLIDQIAFKKSSVNADPNPTGAKANYDQRRAFRISQLEARLRVNPSADLRRMLDDLKIPTRFTVSSTSDRPAFSTAAHEAGHALMFRGGVQNEWSQAIRNIPRSTRLEVSEYAARSNEELWAEITSLVADKREREVPAELLRIYQRIRSAIKVNP